MNQQLSKSAFRRVLGTKVVTELEPAGDYYIAEKVLALLLLSCALITLAVRDLSMIGIPSSQ